MRQEHAAGDKVVDYSGKTIPIVDRDTGEIREAEIFVAVWERPTSHMPKQSGPRLCLIGLVHMSGCFVFLMAFPDRSSRQGVGFKLIRRQGLTGALQDLPDPAARMNPYPVLAVRGTQLKVGRVMVVVKDWREPAACKR